MTRDDRGLLLIISVIATVSFFILASVVAVQASRADSFLACEKPGILYWTQPWAEWGEPIRPVYDLTPPCHLK